MRYFKTTNNGYIASLSTGLGGVEITKGEYDAIKAAFRSMPKAPDGYVCALKEDMTLELCELPVVEEDLSAEEALGIIVGGAV